MTMLFPHLSFIWVLSLFVAAYAFTIPFTAIPSAPGASKKITFSSVKDSNSNNTFSFENLNDVETNDIYVAEVSVNGENFVVQLDTGSSDLWIDTSKADTSNWQKTGLNSAIEYGDGTVAEGPVLVGSVTFGNYTVSQALISAPGSNATTNGDQGLLGVGPPSLSAVEQTLQNSQFNGKSLMQNIFAANPSIPNQMTFQLSRSETTGTTDGGVFTIGEADPDLSQINQQPKLAVTSPDRWVVLMDAMIVNGQNFSGESQFNIPGQGVGQTLANLDTGTSLAEIPQQYVDAIYRGIPGSQFFASQGVYIVPCNTVINVSFVFGGVEYPVHPIDTVTATLDDSGSIVCFSGFTVSSGDTSEDMLLGDSFLRNVYSLFNFGSFISTTSSSPFIQLLATTNPEQAASEFNSLSSQRNQSLSSNQQLPSPTAGPPHHSSANSLSPSPILLALFALFGMSIGPFVL